MSFTMPLLLGVNRIPSLDLRHASCAIMVKTKSDKLRRLAITYPTAYTSGSAWLRSIAVTSALHLLSRHRLSSSPFFTSQHRTSSFAPTKAWPAPLPRFKLPRALLFCVHTTFDEAELTRPKVEDCSYFLAKY